MQQLPIQITGSLPMSRERVMRLVGVTNAYSCQVWLEGNNATINGKSMLGLLSINRSFGRFFTLVTRGEDEAEAIGPIASLLQEMPQNVDS